MRQRPGAQPGASQGYGDWHLQSVELSATTPRALLSVVVGMGSPVEKEPEYFVLEPGDSSNAPELREFSELFRVPPQGQPDLVSTPNDTIPRVHTTLEAGNSGYVEPLLVGLGEGSTASLELNLNSNELERPPTNQLNIARFKSEGLDLPPLRNSIDPSKDAAIPIPHSFLRPSELPYLPNDRTADHQDTLRLSGFPMPQHPAMAMAPGTSMLNRGAGPNYVGSSFLQAEDVMVVEPVLHNQGSTSSTNDAPWPSVALALPSGTGAVPMKSKRGRTRAGRFTCPECNVVFRQTGNLRKHVAEIHQKSKPFRCGVCGNYFSRKHARDTHLKAVHHKLRPFECTLCFKRYKNRSDLNKHMRTVERKEKPHACPICNRAFGERGKLKRHMAIHEKATPTLNSVGSELSSRRDPEQQLEFGQPVLEG